MASDNYAVSYLLQGLIVGTRGGYLGDSQSGTVGLSESLGNMVPPCFAAARLSWNCFTHKISLVDVCWCFFSPLRHSSATLPWSHVECLKSPPPKVKIESFKQVLRGCQGWPARHMQRDTLWKSATGWKMGPPIPIAVIRTPLMEMVDFFQPAMFVRDELLQELWTLWDAMGTS